MWVWWCCADGEQRPSRVAIDRRFDIKIVKIDVMRSETRCVVVLEQVEDSKRIAP